ncbi:hypothetical protein KEF29_37370 [Streptomyces tuirus]|uniref:Uncharacterized protein n=1 Tax=Streptomyces tuirus TaxID=68278 RepID=A0A941J8V9_9ACTN|nr:hypothetical protein [Streptomyces tuirus]
MNLVPQVESAEISDLDLDTIAGGQAGGSPVGIAAGGAAGLYVEAGPVGVGAGVGASVSPQGVAADLHLSSTLY